MSCLFLGTDRVESSNPHKQHKTIESIPSKTKTKNYPAYAYANTVVPFTISALNFIKI